MKFSIDVADNLRETKIHGEPSFPFEKHICRFALSSTGIVRWHWHPEVEIITVTRGRVICSAGVESFVLDEGDCILINSNVLHMYVPMEGYADSEHKAILFQPVLIADPSSVIHESYIQPVITCRSMPYIRFNKTVNWQSEALDLLEEVRSLDPETCFGYELRCRNLLSTLWLLIADHMRGVYQGADISESQLINEQRTKRMLAFIHHHYGEELTIDSIAASASISRSECFRCFKRSINKKPIEYLTEYRIEQAVHLLSESNLSITDICYRCGFGSPSYFGKVFRSSVGVTPREYRHQLNIDIPEPDASEF